MLPYDELLTRLQQKSLFRELRTIQEIRGPLVQIAISLLGILIMIATASLISWYKEMEGRSPNARVKSPDADLAGGEA